HGYDDRDLRHQADAEPDDEHRRQGDLRYAVEERDVRIQNIAEPFYPSAEKADGDAGDSSDHVPHRHFFYRRIEVLPDHARGDDIDDAAGNFDRLAHQPGDTRPLPGREFPKHERAEAGKKDEKGAKVCECESFLRWFTGVLIC